MIVAIAGSPSSGKTSLSVALAYKLSLVQRVVLVCLDKSVPLNLLLKKNVKAPSLGEIIEEPIRDRETYYQAMEDLGDNLAVMSYARFEHNKKYAIIEKENMKDFLVGLRGVVDTIIIDTNSYIDYDNLSLSAIENADKLINVYTNSVKDILYFDSIDMFIPRFTKDNTINVFNKVKNKNINSYYQGKIDYGKNLTIAYDEEIEDFLEDGEMEKIGKNPDFNTATNEIIKQFGFYTIEDDENEEKKTKKPKRKKGKKEFKFFKNMKDKLKSKEKDEKGIYISEDDFEDWDDF